MRPGENVQGGERLIETHELKPLNVKEILTYSYFLKKKNGF